MTNNNIFRREHDKVHVKANKASRNACKQVASYKKQRIEFDPAVELLEKETLVLRLHPQFDSTTRSWVGRNVI